MSPGGRNCPWPRLMCRTSSRSLVEPSTTTSRLSAPRETSVRADCQRSDAADRIAAQQGLRIVQRELARDLPEQHPRPDARGFGAPGQHDDQVGSQRGKLIDHITARALAQPGQHHHSRHADGHREDHQQSAAAAAAQAAGCELYDIDRSHRLLPVSLMIRPSTMCSWRCARAPITGSCVTTISVTRCATSCSRRFNTSLPVV